MTHLCEKFIKRIEILAGGYSREKIVSDKSAQNIMKYLDKSKYEPVLVTVDVNSWEASYNNAVYTIDLNDFSFLADGKKIKFSLKIFFNKP